KTLSYQVNLLGGKPRTEIATYMQKTDFYIHAADIETFSIVTAEALSTGTPVIASNNTALPELVNETNGVLSENNTEDFAQGILKAIATDFDSESISKKMEGRFSYQKVGNNFLEVYNQIISSFSTT
ncbi:MAG: glycosyltransferase, partial [Cytophagales bacterium]|nr:glycosyltransferase [Cytophagales bacterium]